MTIESNDDPVGTGAQPDPAGDDSQSEQVSSEIGVDPGAIEDPGPSAEMLRVQAGIEIPGNLAGHWDNASADAFYDAALKEGVEPEVVSRLVNLYAKGQSERLPGLRERP